MARSGPGGGNTPRRRSAPRRRSPRPYGPRIARYAAKLGKSPDQLTAEEKRKARGHAAEAAEKRERRARTHRDYGVSPETLTRLRKAALEHLLAELGPSRAKNPLDPSTRDYQNRVRRIRENLRGQSGEGLAMILQLDNDAIRSAAAQDYDQIIATYPEFKDLLPRQPRAPIWYN